MNTHEINNDNGSPSRQTFATFAIMRRMRGGECARWFSNFSWLAEHAPARFNMGECAGICAAIYRSSLLCSQACFRMREGRRSSSDNVACLYKPGADPGSCVVFITDCDEGRCIEVSVSLDSGPEFKPDHVRVEGDDAVSFAVLIDATKPSKSILLPKIEESFAQLAEDSFKRSDNVSIYVMSCSLVRTAYNLTPDPSLNEALKKAVATTGAEQADHKGNCKQDIPLWDSIARRYATIAETESLSRADRDYRRIRFRQQELMERGTAADSANVCSSFRCLTRA